MPTARDGITIRRQQNEELRDMIAWEQYHDSGDASELRPLSDRMVDIYRRAIDTLDEIILQLGAHEVEQPSSVGISQQFPAAASHPRAPTGSPLRWRGSTLGGF